MQEWIQKAKEEKMRKTCGFPCVIYWGKLVLSLLWSILLMYPAIRYWMQQLPSIVAALRVYYGVDLFWLEYFYYDMDRLPMDLALYYKQICELNVIFQEMLNYVLFAFAALFLVVKVC